MNSKMQEVTLEELTEKESSSGAKKKIWEAVKKIDMSIFVSLELKAFENYRHVERTHQAFTYEREINSKRYRISTDTKKYEILSVDNSHRLAVLELKEVETW